MFPLPRLYDVNQTDLLNWAHNLVGTLERFLVAGQQYGIIAAPAGPAGGGLKGQYPNPTVTGVFKLGTENTLSPVANSTVHTQAHGLGRKPDIVELWLENLTGELGYSAGDRVYFNANNNVAVAADGTNTVITVNASAVSINRKDTGVNASITLANWKAVAAPLTFTTAF